MQTLDFISCLHDCHKFSQPLSCLYQAIILCKTENVFYCLGSCTEIKPYNHFLLLWGVTKRYCLIGGSIVWLSLILVSLTMSKWFSWQHHKDVFLINSFLETPFSLRKGQDMWVLIHENWESRSKELWNIHKLELERELVVHPSVDFIDWI